ncbi:MAG TPA: 5'-nucleotidase C-terminal domain-containing protein, partial [Longimicrobiales bacterium]
TVDGIKVGVIGLTTEETPAVTKPSDVAGLEFRSGAAAMNEWVPKLRAQGADFVIVVAPSGAECDRDFTRCTGEMVDWAKQVTHKPDLIVAGHTHRLVRWVENGIPIVEAASYSTRYGVTDLVKDSTGVRAWIRGFPVTYVDRVQPTPQITQLVQRYQREIGPQVSRVIATLTEDVRRAGPDSPLGNLIADAYRASAKAQVSFVNNGGIRTSELPAGPVTWGQLYSLQPFENRMVRLTMTGAAIKNVVEQAVSGDSPAMHVGGMQVTYKSSAPAGQRVQRIVLSNGEEVRTDATYTVGVPDFLAQAGDGYRGFADATGNVDAGVRDLEGLINYLQSLPQPVRVDQSERRFIVVP